MKKSISLLLILILSNYAFCQLTDSSFMAQLRTKAENDTKEAYNNTTSLMFSIIFNQKIYKSLSKNIKDNVKTAQVFNRIATVINPSDDKLTGQSYNQYIRKVAFNTLVQPNDDGGDKQRIKRVVTNLTRKNVNPIGQVIDNVIQGFVSSTPILNVVSNVLNGVSTFFKAKMKKGYVENIDQTLDSVRFENFNKAIKPYVDFYDRALTINSEFDQNINELLIEASVSDDSLQAALKEFIASFNGKVPNKVTNVEQIRAAFPSYDFKTYYLKEQNFDHYDKLSAKANQIWKMILKADNISNRANFLVRQYFLSYVTLMKNFQGQIKSPDNLNKINLDGILVPIDQYLGLDTNTPVTDQMRADAIKSTTTVPSLLSNNQIAQFQSSVEKTHFIEFNKNYLNNREGKTVALSSQHIIGNYLTIAFIVLLFVILYFFTSHRANKKTKEYFEKRMSEMEQSIQKEH